MGKIENDEERKIKNEHFIKAFEYIAKMLGMSQGELAEAIGSKSSYISNFRKGLRPVPEETIAGLINMSAKREGLQIFSEYLYGNSEIMLLHNVSDKEILDAGSRRDNPDYETIQKQKSSNEGIPEMSSVFNAALAAKDEAISQLKQRLLDKEEIIQSLRDQLSTKDQLISEQKARLIEYRRLIDSRDLANNYPFPVGVADENHKRKRL